MTRNSSKGECEPTFYCSINQCLPSASAVICLWFIFELQKSATIAFSRNSLYFLPTPEIPSVKSFHAFGFPILNNPPCPQNSIIIIVNPPSLSEILKAIPGIGMDIFSGIAHCFSTKRPSTFVSEGYKFVCECPP